MTYYMLYCTTHSALGTCWCWQVFFNWTVIADSSTLTGHGDEAWTASALRPLYFFVERVLFSQASSSNPDSFPARTGGVKGESKGEQLLRMPLACSIVQCWQTLTHRTLACWRWKVYKIAWLDTPIWLLTSGPLWLVQYSISQPYAPGLYRALCSWMRGWMQYNDHHSDRFVYRTDCSLYDSYDITHSNFVSIFCR